MVLLFIFGLSSMLVACSDKSSKEDKPTEGEKTTEEEKKKTFTILENGEGVEYVNGLEPGADDQYVNELKRLSGFDVEYEIIPLQEYGEKLPILFASGDLPDLIRSGSINNSAHKGAVESGALLELNDLLEEHGQNILKNIPQEVWDNPDVSVDGKIYGIPQLGAVEKGGTVTYMRKDWLDKLDMDVPETLDDWLAYFEGVKQNDMNGNGDPDDEYGYVMRKAFPGNVLFFGAFGVHPSAWNLQDGKIIPDMIKPEMKDAIAFYRDLYAEGYINKNLFTHEGSDWNADIYSGNAGSWVHDILNYAGGWGDTSAYDNSEEVDITMAPAPKGPSESRGLAIDAGISFRSVYVIPSETGRAEEIIKFLDWAWSSEEAEKFFALGIEGHNYTVDDNGEITWDPESPENSEENAMTAYRVVLNVTGDARMSPLALEHMEDGDLIEERKNAISENELLSDESINMPLLDVYKESPEIVPGVGDGTLFLEMFSKVMTGREDLDKAFDTFVEKWKKRGGDQAIEEANEWYNDLNE